MEDSVIISSSIVCSFLSLSLFSFWDFIVHTLFCLMVSYMSLRLCLLFFKSFFFPFLRLGHFYGSIFKFADSFFCLLKFALNPYVTSKEVCSKAETTTACTFQVLDSITEKNLSTSQIVKQEGSTLLESKKYTLKKDSMWAELTEWVALFWTRVSTFIKEQ